MYFRLQELTPKHIGLTWVSRFTINSPFPYILFNTIPCTVHHVLLRQDVQERGWRKRSELWRKGQEGGCLKGQEPLASSYRPTSPSSHNVERCCSSVLRCAVSSESESRYIFCRGPSADQSPQVDPSAHVSVWGARDGRAEQTVSAACLTVCVSEFVSLVGLRDVGVERC